MSEPKKRGISLLLAVIVIGFSGCSSSNMENDRSHEPTISENVSSYNSEDEEDRGTNTLVTEGTEMYQGFLLDNVLHSETEGDIHYNLYVPENYDGSTPYSLFVTLPGYEGLYFQGVGENLKIEAYGFEAQKYKENLIVAAPQLNDWGETSAEQAIALTEYLLSNYNIDPDQVYLNGYSGGGETGSLVMEKRPELYTAYLAVSTRWDGELGPLVEAETPVYLVVGEDDSYYGSEPLKETYARLYSLYEEKGLTAEEIEQILVLDVRDQTYFSEQGYSDQHAGGLAFAFDTQVMGWLFGK